MEQKNDEIDLKGLAELLCQALRAGGFEVGVVEGRATAQFVDVVVATPEVWPLLHIADWLHLLFPGSTLYIFRCVAGVNVQWSGVGLRDYQPHFFIPHREVRDGDHRDSSWEAGSRARDAVLR